MRILILSLDFLHSFTLNAQNNELDCFKAGIYHLDIQPENIVFDENGVCKLINFNVLLAFNRGLNKEIIQKFNRSYMAPELKESCTSLKFRYVRSKADVYSFGLTMLETILLEDVTSYESDELNNAIENLENPELKNVIGQCLQKNHESRPSFKELKAMVRNTSS